MTYLKQLGLAFLCVVGLTVPAYGQGFVRLQTSGIEDTLSSNGDTIELTNVQIGSFGAVKIQTKDTYSGTWEVQCAVFGSTYDEDNELKLQLADSTSTVYEVTDVVGIWDILNAGGCRSIRVVATAGFAATDTVVALTATQIGGGSGGGGSSGGGLTDTELRAAAVAVTCGDCSGSGVSHIDDAVFTVATSDIVPIAGVYQATPDSVNDTDAGAVRMSINRNLLTSIRDAAGNERGANVSAGNALIVDGSAATQPVSGTVTANLGATDNAVLDDIADGIAVTGTVTANLSATDNAVLDDIADGIAVTGTVTANAGTNLNTSALLTTAAHDAAFGTAGTSDTQVLSVQGIAAGTALGVSGTVTANAGTNLNTANIESYTSRLLSGATPIAPATATATTGFLIGGQYNSTPPTFTNGQQGGFQMTSAGALIVTGGGGAVTNAGTFVVQENGAALTALQLIDNAISGAGFNITQLNGAAVPIGAGVEATALRVTLATDSTGVVSIDDNGGIITVDGSISCSNCTGSGASDVDDSSFTIATDSVAPAGFLFDDVTPDTVNEGDVGLARMSANRVPYQTIRDAAGNERGANVSAGNALLVDASATTQPVSGTVTANAGTNLNTSALLTTTAHDAAFGTAGTADTQVLSVQGIASMTPLLVGDGTGAFNVIVDSGTITAVTTITNAVTITDGAGAVNVICDSGCAGGTQYAEDAAHASGNTGTLTLVVRNDAGTALAADGDNIPLMVNSAGALFVATGTVTVTDGAGALNTIIDSGTVTTVSTVTNLSQQGGVAISLNTGVRDTGTQRVTIATNDVVPVSQSGTWDEVGINDSGNSITVDGTITVTDGAGVLNTIVDSGTLTAVTTITNPVTITDGAGAVNVICDSGCSGGTQYAEDAVHASGNTGTLALAVRNDAGTPLAADGDNIPLMMNEDGALFVLDINSSTLLAEIVILGNVTEGIFDDGVLSRTALQIIDNLPNTIGSTTSGQSGVLGLCAVTTGAPTYTTAQSHPCSLDTTGALRVSGASGGAVTNAGTFAVQSVEAAGALLTSAQLTDNIVSVEDAVAGSAFSGVGFLAVRQDSHADLAADGDFIPVTVDADGGLRVSIVAGAGSGGTALADDADFTAGTTSFTPAGGFYQSSVTACTDGDTCAVGITAQRTVKTTLFSAAGSELTIASDLTVGTAFGTTGPGLLTSYKEFDGAALPTTANVGTELEANPLATSLQGVVYNMSVNEDGSKQLGKLEDDAHVTADFAMPILARYIATPVVSAGTSGDYATIDVSEEGAAYTTPIATNAGGATPVRFISAGATEDEHAVCTGPCNLYSITVTNINAAIRYLKCENDTTGGTAPGTDTPEFSIALPIGGGASTSYPVGKFFSTALTCWIVTGAADSDVAEVAANEIMVNYDIKQ